VKEEVRVRFCSALQSVMEVQAEEWKKHIEEGRLEMAMEVLRGLDLMATVRAKVCGGGRRW